MYGDWSTFNFELKGEHNTRSGPEHTHRLVLEVSQITEHQLQLYAGALLGS